MVPTGPDEGATASARSWEKPYLYGGRDSVRSVDVDERHRPPKDLFGRLREARWTTVRLVAEAVAMVVGICLLAGVGVSAPLLGAGMIAVGLIAGIVDLVLLRRLRRGTAEAWVDLSLPPDGRE